MLYKLDGDGIIRLTLGDWRWNASLTGFINIIGEENVSIKGRSAEVPVKCLEKFEEKYFKYLIDTYEKTLPWFKIITFRKTIEYFKECGFETLDLQGLKSINAYVKDTAKRYLSSNSVKSAFELMGNAEYMEYLEKSLQKVKEPKDEEAFKKEKCSILAEVKKQFEVIEKIIEACMNENGKRFIGAKNVIYTIVKNGWNGVSFLNPQTKTKDMYEDFRNYFVESTLIYIAASKEKYKFKCFYCGAPIKNLNSDMSFLNQTGFDVDRKTSHVWNFVNDVAICPVCKLVYSCLSAGFIYIHDMGLFINSNLDLRNCLRINNNLKKSLINGDYEPGSRRIYSLLLETLIQQRTKDLKYLLANVQVVRYEKESYNFNLLTEETITLLNTFSIEIAGLIRTGCHVGKECFSVYEHVLNHIFNNQNLLPIIYKLLHYKTLIPNSCFFHTGHVLNILKINVNLVQNLGGLESMGNSLYRINTARDSGVELRELSLKKDPKTGKLPGTYYRLLNAIKSGERYIFMEILLNFYVRLGKEIPRMITEALKEEDDFFKTIGYAFVAGFIAGKKDENETGEDREENESWVI